MEQKSHCDVYLIQDVEPIDLTSQPCCPVCFDISEIDEERQIPAPEMNSTQNFRRF